MRELSVRSDRKCKQRRKTNVKSYREGCASATQKDSTSATMQWDAVLTVMSV